MKGGGGGWKDGWMDSSNVQCISLVICIHMYKLGIRSVRRRMSRAVSVALMVDSYIHSIVARKCLVSLGSIYHHMNYMYTHKPSYIVSAIGLCLRLS